MRMLTCRGCGQEWPENETHHCTGTPFSTDAASVKLTSLLAGYLVEWEDDDGPNDIFFRKEEWANCRADEVRAGGFKGVTVTPLYKQVAS